MDYPLLNPIVWESECNLHPINAKRLTKYNAELANRNAEMQNTNAEMLIKAKRNGIAFQDSVTRNAKRNPNWKIRPKWADGVIGFDATIPGYQGYTNMQNGNVGKK